MRRVLVTGASGFLGTAACAALVASGAEVVAVSHGTDAGAGAGREAASGRPGVIRHGVELTDAAAVARLFAATRPDALLHVASLPDIAPCEADPARAQRLNAEVPGELAALCAAAGQRPDGSPVVRLVQVSTDQVFDGSHGAWNEQDAPAPLHVYGRSKLAGERAVHAACPGALVVRLALLTGPAPPGRRSSSGALREAWARGESVRLFTDEVRTPLAVADAARALAELLTADEAWVPAGGGARPALPAGRIVHLGGDERLTRFELGRREALAAGVDPVRVLPTTRAAAGLDRLRPADLTLDSARLVAFLGWRPRALA